MQSTTMIEVLGEFADRNTLLLGAVQCGRLGPIEGRWLDRDGKIFDRQPGIYLMSRMDGTVFYVGKSEGAILDRLWQHVNTPTTARRDSPTREGIVVFPNHRWQNNANVGSETKAMLERGEFLVSGLAINPAQYATLFESMALAVAHRTDGKLPELNFEF